LTDILDCQVVYFGRSSPVDANPLLIQLAKHPILTIGHSEDFCSYAGLFCLIPGNGGFRIAANLDSISRNGLRVNPLLLKLTSRERKAGP
jgi:hypothetical protein